MHRLVPFQDFEKGTNTYLIGKWKIAEITLYRYIYIYVQQAMKKVAGSSTGLSLALVDLVLDVYRVSTRIQQIPHSFLVAPGLIRVIICWKTVWTVCERPSALEMPNGSRLSCRRRRRSLSLLSDFRNSQSVSQSLSSIPTFLSQNFGLQSSLEDRERHVRLVIG